VQFFEGDDMSIIWFNGAVVENQINIDPSDRGLTLGDGLFETILVQGTKVVWLNDHVQRMKRAADELGIGLDEALLHTGVAVVLKNSNLTKSVLRITLTRGVVSPRALTGFGASPNLLITLSEFSGGAASSITLATSSIRRNETSPSCRMKTLSYIDNIAAAREVTARADDALMLNTKGHVACTSIGNVFLLKGDELITPRADQGILLGITRSKLLARAREAIVTTEDLFTADAVFRTNSLRLVTQVSKVDDRPLNMRSLDDIQNLITERIAHEIFC
jgi:branched-chain amino acid aminotransferase